MDPKHLEELIRIERRYWWHVAKRDLVRELLGQHAPPPGILVEGGVGGGANLLAFRDQGYRVSGFDLMPEAVENCRTLGLNDVHVHDLQELWPSAGRRARAVVMLDVIEHVPDPVRVLRNAVAMLDDDGAILVTVPAAPYLIGPWDRMLGHYRRYSARLLRDHAHEAGLRIAWLSHWNAFALPLAIVIRTAEKLSGRQRTAEFPAVSDTVNSLLIGLARLERRLMTLVPLASGLSLVGVLKHEQSNGRRAAVDRRDRCLGSLARLQRGARARDADALRP